MKIRHGIYEYFIFVGLYIITAFDLLQVAACMMFFFFLHSLHIALGKSVIVHVAT